MGYRTVGLATSALAVSGPFPSPACSRQSPIASAHLPTTARRTAASVGFYSDCADDVDAVECTAGRHSTQRACEAGNYCQDGVRTPCPSNTFQAAPAKTYCDAATPGSHVATTLGATEQTLCPPGFFCGKYCCAARTGACSPQQPCMSMNPLAAATFEETNVDWSLDSGSCSEQQSQLGIGSGNLVYHSSTFNTQSDALSGCKETCSGHAECKSFDLNTTSMVCYFRRCVASSRLVDTHGTPLRTLVRKVHKVVCHPTNYCPEGSDAQDKCPAGRLRFHYARTARNTCWKKTQMPAHLYIAGEAVVFVGRRQTHSYIGSSTP